VNAKVLYSTGAGVARITLNRPAKRNALDGEMIAGARQALAQSAEDDAVRIVVESGKASTSLLQRRLRLGYGRAARLIDMMQKDGIVSAPDGSRPREVLKRPEWLREVDESLR
jgi:S-DNA-T family DNA segregation ATPase FtsK/SpoIIIE